MPYTYEHPHFALTVDAILLAENEQGLHVLLIQRKNPPYQHDWAFPGGFVDIDEEIEAAAYRELEEETGINSVKLTRLDVFDRVDRDPRERVVTVAYYGYVSMEGLQIKAKDDARAVKWFNLEQLPSLAFDHAHILASLLKNQQKSAPQSLKA